MTTRTAQDYCVNPQGVAVSDSQWQYRMTVSPRASAAVVEAEDRPLAVPAVLVREHHCERAGAFLRSRFGKEDISSEHKTYFP